MGQEVSDPEFVAGLRAATERYLSAVDQWEKAYRKYYRLPGYAAKISGDLEAEQGLPCPRGLSHEREIPLSAWFDSVGLELGEALLGLLP